MKRAKKPKPERYSLTRADIKKLAEEQTSKAFILMATAAADEAGLTDEQIAAMAQRAARYAEYIDQHIVRINEVSDILERNTGIRWRW